MKTPEEWINSVKRDTDHFADQEFSEDDLINMIILIQKESYNEGITDAADNAEVKRNVYVNPYSDSDGEVSYDVDKKSILKFLKK